MPETYREQHQGPLTIDRYVYQSPSPEIDTFIRVPSPRYVRTSGVYHRQILISGVLYTIGRP